LLEPDGRAASKKKMERDGKGKKVRNHDSVKKRKKKSIRDTLGQDGERKNDPGPPIRSKRAIGGALTARIELSFQSGGGKKIGSLPGPEKSRTAGYRRYERMAQRKSNSFTKKGNKRAQRKQFCLEKATTSTLFVGGPAPKPAGGTQRWFELSEAYQRKGTTRGST